MRSVDYVEHCYYYYYYYYCCILVLIVIKFTDIIATKIISGCNVI
jgi:hypothetical protein